MKRFSKLPKHWEVALTTSFPGGWPIPNKLMFMKPKTGAEFVYVRNESSTEIYMEGRISAHEQSRLLRFSRERMDSTFGELKDDPRSFYD